MAQRKTLTLAQVELLRWINEGCLEGIYEGVYHRISVAAPDKCRPSRTAPTKIAPEEPIEGTYRPHGFLRVLTSPAVPATISIDGATANAYGVWTNKAPGTYTVCFGPVAGYVTPPCQTGVAVTANNTTTVTGTYNPHLAQGSPTMGSLAGQSGP